MVASQDGLHVLPATAMHLWMPGQQASLRSCVEDRTFFPLPSILKYLVPIAQGVLHCLFQYCVSMSSLVPEAPTTTLAHRNVFWVPKTAIGRFPTTSGVV